MFRVLLVEDAEESKDLVIKALGSSYEIHWAANLQQADQILRKEKHNLVLLDVGLPDGDGFHFYSMIKNDDSFKDIPVIFLTSRDSVADKVMGISLGADDYMNKPFLAAELKARVEMRIKKSLDRNEQGKVIKKGDLEINLSEQRAYLNSINAKLDLGLTPLEFKLLTLLVSHEENVFSREQLLNQVWGNNTYLTDRCIDTHVYTLRKKLGSISNWVQSVYGQGYRLSRRSAKEKAAA
jgi:two-component system phosphate regulon response regulator PhoB